MGSFNTTSCITRVPIRWGDKIMVFLSKISDANNMACYPTDRVSPIFLPFEATYYDYGYPEKVVKCAVTTALEEIFCTNIQYIIEIFSERVGRRDYTHLKDTNTGDFYESIKKLSMFVDTEEYLNSLVLTYEHYDAYAYLSKSASMSDYGGYMPAMPQLRVAFLVNMLGLTYDQDTQIFNKEGSKISFKCVTNTPTFFYDGILEAESTYPYLGTLVKTWNEIAVKYNEPNIVILNDYNKSIIMACSSMAHSYKWKITNNFVLSIDKCNDDCDDVYSTSWDAFNIRMMISDAMVFPSFVSLNFIRTQECICSQDLVDSTASFLNCIGNMSILNLFFGLSDYANQDIDYSELLKYENFRTSLVTKLHNEYVDNCDGEYEE